MAEIHHWLKTICDCREACQRFTDNIKTSLHRTEIFTQTATNPRPASRVMTELFKDSFEHTYASFLDIWKAFDETGSPYHKLARLNGEEQEAINQRISNTWALHDIYEQDVLAKRKEFRKACYQFQQVKKEFPHAEARSGTQANRLTDLKSRLKMALVKYRIAYREEYDHRFSLQKKLREIENAWQAKEMVNLKLLGETLRMFKQIIFDLAPDNIRSTLGPTLEAAPMLRREMRAYIRALHGSAKKTREFLKYEGPVLTNPTLRVMPRPAGKKDNFPKHKVIKEGWGPFKKQVCFSESSTRILDSDDDYIMDITSPLVRRRVPQVASLVSRLENVRLMATKYYLQEEPREISLTPGTAVVQVKSANEKGMSYGYKRGKLGLRKYGYYPADAVALT